MQEGRWLGMLPSINWSQLDWTELWEVELTEPIKHDEAPTGASIHVMRNWKEHPKEEE